MKKGKKKKRVKEKKNGQREICAIKPTERKRGGGRDSQTEGKAVGKATSTRDTSWPE